MKRLIYNLIIVSILALATLSSCNKEDEPFFIKKPSEQTSSIVYLNELLNIMENYSINKHNINWVIFKDKVFNTVPTAHTISETYPGIKEALTLLNDRHSSYTASNGNTIMGSSAITITMENIVTPVMPDDVGYVKVNYYSGQSNDALAIAFANQIQNQIKQQDHSDLKGWIVDLRNNIGGNMWPMLAGIGPILGEGISGYFIDPDENEKSWGIDNNGASIMNGSPLTQLSNSYELLTPKPKVAVLLNYAVASSGEVIAISFIGRENTKSFGSATCGLSTANSTFRLSDNSNLNLTTAYLADRNKNKYGIPIIPDVLSKKETIINDVLAWIRE